MSRKEKDPRTYDQDGYKRRASCVCIKDEHQKEVLLVSSSKYVNKWIIPGGAIEEGEDPQSAAIREVEEEAGVRGKVKEFLGVFQNEISKSRTYVYILLVDNNFSDVESKENRQRKWFDIHQAIEELNHKPAQQLYLLKLKDKNANKKCENCESSKLNLFFEVS